MMRRRRYGRFNRKAKTREAYEDNEGRQKDYSEYKNKSVKRYNYNGSGSRGSEVWDSGLSVLEDPEIHVPRHIQEIAIAIQEEVGRPEWGALFRGEWTENGFQVLPDYVIPEQKVSRAHIDYEEDLKKYRERGYVVNMHSHPFSGSNAGFSGVDDDHINSHFDCALLYAGKAEEIVDGLLNVDVSDGVRVQIDADLNVERERARLPDVDISNITERSRSTGSGSTSRGSKGSGTVTRRTEYISKDGQNRETQKDDSYHKSTVKIPKSDLIGTDMDFEDVDGVEVVDDLEADAEEYTE